MNRLGKTELKVSTIGFGGVIVIGEAPKHAAKLVAEAVEYGINYFDVAPSYDDAEIKLGPALKPFRKDVYLACKTHFRDAKGAKETLEQSLKNLKTDYFDVYQLHGLTDVENDVKASFAAGGAMEVILKAKKQGIIRNVGFSAHTPQAAIAAMKEYDFDTVMYPVNFGLHFKKKWEVQVLKEARKRDMGIIALKALARQKRPDDKRTTYPKCWYVPIDDPELARLAFSWTISQGISVAISPGEEILLKLMMKILPKCKKPNDREIQKLSSIAEKYEPIF